MLRTIFIKTHTLILDYMVIRTCLHNCFLFTEKTPMCLINELARYNKTTHQYRLTDESGPAHKKSFTVCLRLGGTGNDSGSSAKTGPKGEPGFPATPADEAAIAAVAAGEDYIATGPSIKKAQHAAAALALERTAFKHPPPKPQNPKTPAARNIF